MSGYKALTGLDITNVDGTTTHYNTNDIVPLEKLMPRKFDWLVERGFLEGTLSGTTSLPDNLSVTGTVSASGLAGSLLSSASPVMDSSAAAGTSAIPSRQDHVHPSDTTLAPLAGATFTGDVTIDKTTPVLHLKSDYADDTLAYLKVTRKAGKWGGTFLYTDDNSGTPKARWYAGADDVTETGSNIGSDFTFVSYIDDGSTPTTRITVSRSTGQVKLSDELIAKANAFCANKTTDFTSANNTWETLTTWNSEADPQAGFNTTSGEYTLPETGLWLVTGEITFAANATGARAARILAGGSVNAALSTQPGMATTSSRVTCTGIISANASTVIVLQSFQLSTGDLVVQDAMFGATYLGKGS